MTAVVEDVEEKQGQDAALKAAALRKNLRA
jgi:hypothetical protein